METKLISQSVVFKILIVLFLTLLLLIPAYMIEALVRERQYRKSTVVSEITEKWGQKQIIGGPVLTVPYDEIYRDEHGQLRTRSRYACFLPDSLKITGDIHPEIRYRSIYNTVVYRTDLRMEGELKQPEVEKLNIRREDMRWEDAFLVIAITDMAGIREQIYVNINGEDRNVSPGTKIMDIFSSGVHVEYPVDLNKPVRFSLKLKLNGSQELKLYPLGRETQVILESDWKNPSFLGKFLPVEREISDSGFKARWEVINLNRNYPQQWTDLDSSNIRINIGNSAFGVNLLQTVDLYQKTTRSIKYAIMFIGMTFLVYFIIEILNKYNIHPIQYTLVGFSLVVFYLLLLSLSEHIHFWFAYVIASISTILLISLFTSAILKEKKPAIIIAAFLSILYIFLYILLESQDYALLLGSIGVFITLAIFMYLTRNIDWYSIRLEEISPDKKDPE